MGYRDYYKRLENETRRIKESDELSDRDKELLLGFKRDLKLQQMSDSALHSLLVYTRKMAERIEGADLETATREDLKDVMMWIEERDVAEATKQDYRKAAKRFYRWWNDGDGFPEKIDWVTTTRKSRTKKLPQDMLRETEIEDMKKATLNPRDRAFVATIWETGARIGELLSLKVRDVEDSKYGMKLTIQAQAGNKTGARRIPLVSSVPALNNWLENHPRRDDPDAPLWCAIEGERRGEEISYRRITDMLKTVAERAGVDKPVNPHMFRHSRATYLASRMTESQMCQFLGWVQGSDQPQRYIHLAGKDLDADYARMHGIETGKPEESKLSPQKCPRCGDLNEPEASYCQHCGQALDTRAAVEAETRKDIVERIAGGMESLEDKRVEDGTVKEALREVVRKELEEMITG